MWLTLFPQAMASCRLHACQVPKTVQHCGIQKGLCYQCAVSVLMQGPAVQTIGCSKSQVSSELTAQVKEMVERDKVREERTGTGWQHQGSGSQRPRAWSCQVLGFNVSLAQSDVETVLLWLCFMTRSSALHLRMQEDTIRKKRQQLLDEEKLLEQERTVRMPELCGTRLSRHSCCLHEESSPAGSSTRWGLFLQSPNREGSAQSLVLSLAGFTSLPPPAPCWM